MATKKVKGAKQPERAEAVLVDEVEVGPIHAHIGFKLRMAQVAVFRSVVNAFRPFDLRPSHYSALKLVATNPGLRQQRLGETLEIKRPNLVLLVAELEDRGWLERRRTAADKRSYALYLTKEGKALIAAADNAHEVHEQRLRAILGDDLGRFCDALERIHTELAEPDA